MIILKHIEMTLDPSSIEKAIRQIEEFESKLKPAMINLINSLTQQGAIIAKANLVMFEQPAFDTGELQDSIESVPYDGSAGYVRTTCPYAIYVEYGTGPRGAISPHPAGDGEYRPTGWTYYNDRIGRVLFTYGMGSRPFMYNAFRSIEQEAESRGGRIIAEYMAGV